MARQETLFLLGGIVAEGDSFELDDYDSDHVDEIDEEESDGHVYVAAVVVPVEEELEEEDQVDVQAEEVEGAKLEELHQGRVDID